MAGTFLESSANSGLLTKEASIAYAKFLSEVERCTEAAVPIHGLEVHLPLEGIEMVSTKTDFACMVECIVSSREMPWLDLAKRLQQLLDSSAIWIELDSDQLQPHTPYPVGIPLLYFSPNTPCTPTSFADAGLKDLLGVMENWTEINGWSGLPVPDRPSVEQWLNRLPLGSEIQQIGLAFRRGRVQPRVLLNIPETGEVLKLLDPLKVPKALIEQKLEEQMLIAAAYPHPTSELMGLEILADRCGVNNLRQMRRQPQFRGSKTERLLKNLLPSNEEAISRLSSIEGRSSRLVENGIHVTLRGINHLKAVLSQGTLKSMKAYLGEVNNHFQRTSGGIAAR